MFAVIITNRYMADFVTSHTAKVLFGTRAECEQYIKNLETNFPGRQFCRIEAPSGTDAKDTRYVITRADGTREEL